MSNLRRRKEVIPLKVARETIKPSLNVINPIPFVILGERVPAKRNIREVVVAKS